MNATDIQDALLECSNRKLKLHGYLGHPSWGLEAQLRALGREEEGLIDHAIALRDFYEAELEVLRQILEDV